MSLDIPELDDRTYEALREDALKRLPVHAPEWTDHNAHDPGITLLELLAWLVETYGYQLDRITDAHRKKYLDLVGITPRKPREATVELSVGFEGDEWYVPRHTPLTAETPDGDEVPFETVDDVVLTDAELAAIVSDHRGGRTDYTRANDREGSTVLAYGEDASVGNALYLGFDGDPFGEAHRLDLSFAFHAGAVPDVSRQPSDPERFTPSLRVDWEWCTDPGRWYADVWEPIDVLGDETNEFYRGGRVTLAAPENWSDEAKAGVILDRDEPLVWIRAMVREREPPEPEHVICEASSSDAGTDASTDGATANTRYEFPPEFDSIHTNTITARHTRRVPAESLVRVDDDVGDRPIQQPTETTGIRSQRFEFPDAPVLETTVSVGGTDWTEVTDFAASGPNDRHYTLDREHGVVSFGDGRRGAIPQPDQPVIAETVRYGGGIQGNVPTDSTWAVEAAQGTWDVAARARPRGGRGRESIPDAFDRARAQQDVPYRAVTAADYRELAIRTPGIHVARAGTIVDCEGDISTSPNEVTVVVVPHGSLGRRPIPTRGFLDAVEYQLCVHSLLTDRVSVVPPTYVSVRVSVEVLAADGVSREDVRAVVEERVDEYIDPLTGYEDDGWPFDRPVHRSDVFDVLERLPVVADAVDVRIQTGNEGELEADQTTLPYLADISVLVREEREKCGRGF